jgi:hypothetical protein
LYLGSKNHLIRLRILPDQLAAQSAMRDLHGMIARCGPP